MGSLTSSIAVAKNNVSRPRVLFLGMPCVFSTIVLQALIDSDVDICAIVVPAHALPGRESPPIEQKTVSRGGLAMAAMMGVTAQTVFFDLAHDSAIPVWNVYRLGAPQTVETLAAYQPDFICVACFPRRIPSAILRIARLTSLNVHPSLLPLHRGPVPLFWTLRAGEQMAGVTIHLMEERFDTGAIVLQESFPIMDGIRYENLEEQCVRLGASLLTQAIQGLFTQTLVPSPQDEKWATYESFPDVADYNVSAQTCSARHLYNFVRGVASRETPVEIEMAGETLYAIDATSYSLNTEDAEDNKKNGVEEGQTWVACRDGVVQIVIA